MIVLPVTSLCVSFFVVMLIGLSVAVSLRRAKVGAMIGDAADEPLLRRIRTHGNFIEYVPIGLIALALVEAAGAPAWTVWTLAGLLVAGRVLHAVGMLASFVPARGGGMVLTYAMLLWSAVRLTLHALS